MSWPCLEHFWWKMTLSIQWTLPPPSFFCRFGHFEILPPTSFSLIFSLFLVCLRFCTSFSTFYLLTNILVSSWSPPRLRTCSLISYLLFSSFPDLGDLLKADTSGTPPILIILPELETIANLLWTSWDGTVSTKTAEELDHHLNCYRAINMQLLNSVQDHLSRLEGSLNIVPFALMHDEGDTVRVHDRLGRLCSAGIGVWTREWNHQGVHEALQLCFLLLITDWVVVC